MLGADHHLFDQDRAAPHRHLVEPNRADPDQATGSDLFPTATKFTRRSTTFELDDGNHRQNIDVKAIYAYDASGTVLGYVIWSHSKTGQTPMPLRWVVDREMRVKSVGPTDDRPEPGLLEACCELRGQPLAEPKAANRLSTLARGLATVVQQMAKRRGNR